MHTLNTAGQALLTRLIAGEQIPVVPLVFFDTPVPQYWALCAIPLVWNSQTWAPLEMGLTEVEVQASTLSGVTFSLPAVTEAELAFAFTDLDGTTARIYHALVDPDTGVVADALQPWAGALDIPGWEDGEKAVVLITGTHRGQLALQPKPSRYTNDEQQRLYPGDTSLNFDPATDAAPLVWPAASYFRQ